jgi:hypothetical protein
MDSTKLHDWLQIIGAVAIVASLIFVGLELRTSRAAAQAQVADGFTEGFISLNVAVMTDETLACIWSVGLEAPERLSDNQVGRFSIFMRGVFNQYMRAHSLYETGYASEAQWENIASTATWLMSTPGGQLFFASNQLPEDFVQAIGPFDAVPQDYLLGRELPTDCSEKYPF